MFFEDGLEPPGWDERPDEPDRRGPTCLDCAGCTEAPDDVQAACMRHLGVRVGWCVTYGEFVTDGETAEQLGNCGEDGCFAPR